MTTVVSPAGRWFEELPEGLLELRPELAKKPKTKSD